jgi:predicted site-specific integrase-resolvase
MEDNLLTLKRVMEILEVKPNTLYNYIKAGKIPVVVISRSKRFIKQSDLDNFINSHTGTYGVKQQPDDNIQQ